MKDRSAEANKNENAAVEEKDGTYVLPEEGLSQKNPFSNVISNDEIDKAKDNTVAKLLFKHDGKVENIESDKDGIMHYDTPNDNGAFSFYFAHKICKDNKSNVLNINAFSVGGQIQPDGSIFVKKNHDKYDTVPMSIKNVRINGVPISSNNINITAKDIIINLPKSVKEGNYVFLQFDADKSTKPQYYIYTSLKENGESVFDSKSYRRVFIAAPHCDAEFHYVNDMQYRKTNNVNADQHLAERSFEDSNKQQNANEIKLSTIPFKSINGITDIRKDTVSNKNPFSLYISDYGEYKYYPSYFYNANMEKLERGENLNFVDFDEPLNFNNADKVPLLSFNMDNQPFVKGELQMSDFTNKTLIDSKTRTCEMPGWIYWDNDIDKPNNGVRQFANDMATVEEMGNHYRSYAYEMKDGKPVKLLTRKHYYVTYRALPTQLTVQYQGLDGKLMDAQPYAILQDGKVIQSWKSRWLSSNKKIEHKSYEDMYNFVKGKRYDIADYQVYDYNGDAYLMPGDYTIAPAIKAPDGYEWVTEKIDNAGNMLQTVKTGEGTDNVHINVLGNKNVDKNVCQYGVRFVLRKIGDKALNNVVALPELPQKSVEKDVVAPSGNGYEMLRDLKRLPTADLNNDGSKGYVSPYELQEVTAKEYNEQHKLGLSESNGDKFYNIVNKVGSKIKNPFSNIISQNDVNLLNGGECIFRMYYTPENSNVSYLLRNYWDSYIPMDVGTYTIYAVRKNVVTNSEVIPGGSSIGNTNTEKYPIKGGPTERTAINDYGTKFDSFQINNTELIKYGKDKTYYFATNFDASEPVYYKMSFKVKNSDFYADFRSTGMPFGEIRLGRAVNAQYHMVDDLQYRVNNKVGIKDKIISRNDSNTHVIDMHNLSDFNKECEKFWNEHPQHDENVEWPFATKDSRQIFEKMDNIKDIAPVISTDGVQYSDDGSVPATLLSFAGDDTYYASRRPSLTQLKGNDIPGYVYIDNDIDLPQNKFNIREYNLKNGTLLNTDYDRGTNGYSYLISGFPLEKDENGYVTKALTTKHYYVTFRKIPTRLIVQYKDQNGNLMDGKRYNLLQDNKALLTAKNPVLTTSHWDGYYDDFDNLKAFVQSKDYAVFGKNNVYYKDGQAYLTDGDYQIQAGVDAPEGYEWVPEVKGGDKFHIDLVKSAKDPTVKVVTMVLRKKPGTAPHINMVVVPTPKPVSPTPVTPGPVQPAPQPVVTVIPVTPQPVTPEHHDVTPVVPPVVTPVVTVPETTIPNVVPEHTKDIPVVENPDLAKLVNNTDTQKAEAHNVKTKPVVSKAIKHAKQQLPKTGAGIVTMLALGLQTMVAGVAMKFKKRK